jgi:hypothetical protein
MEPKNKVITTFLILIFLIAALYLFTNWFSKTTGYIIEDDPDIYLAECLTKKGSKFFTSDSCPNCDSQKQLFGNSAYPHVNSIDCTRNPSECSLLQSLPAWYINGSLHYGLKTTDELRKLSACEGA